jgi:hypothetical protein
MSVTQRKTAKPVLGAGQFAAPQSVQVQERRLPASLNGPHRDSQNLGRVVLRQPLVED